MFLDEQLLQIGRSTDMTNESAHKSISDMINACFSNLSKSIINHKDDGTILSNFKRVNQTWIDVAKMLDNEGKGFVKPDGFKIFVESKPEFQGIFFKLNNK